MSANSQSATDTTISPNGLVCFTNCLLAQEDGSLVQKDLWIDERRGVILDSQINGAYGFDFSIYNKDDEAYREGLDMIARRIVETGVTSLLPTIITQDGSLYPRLLRLLRPHSPAPSAEYPNGGATLLGWHAEGPFISPIKRGAHALPFLRDAPRGIEDFESVYGSDALAHHEDWALQADSNTGGIGVRMVTLAPELPGILSRDTDVIGNLTKRGVCVSIGHSVSGTDTAARAVRHGARMVTHLFNAMPQLHHRDPGIIGLLGASPASLVASSGLKKKHNKSQPSSEDAVAVASPTGTATPNAAGTSFAGAGAVESVEAGGAEALDENDTPPHTPIFRSSPEQLVVQNVDLKLDDVQKIDAKRPFYGMIVDGVHSHPNSVRLAYTAHKEGCILVTDAMKILDPNMPNGTYDWRDGRRVVKEGVRLYIEGTDTLAGSVVTLDTCVRNFVRFTGATLGEALKCATYNPAKCLNIETKKGTLRPGADADLVVLNKEGQVLSTWVSARVDYTSYVVVFFAMRTK
ncbi:Metallo-dependent hydrolase [Sanghuangporus baumii]|uniref:Metallo-dependent hydrolase n=1 Tax=Sanghuangporus baumii TaxID=108892 RepID=A0A9Q5N6L4_SANBA|nr:Metallo-dependent hydrolase [Sanghuangporus baumii]